MQHLLAIMLLALGLLIGAWDVSVTYRGHSGDTVSRIIQSWSVKWPVLPLVFGVLLGHVFWPPDCPKLDQIPRVALPLDEPVRVVPK